MLENLVFLRQMLIELKNRRDVAAAVAVVGCTPNGYDRLIEHQFVPLHCKLVRSGDEVDGVVMRESLGDVRSKKEACSTGRETPASYIIWVRPKKVAHCPVVRDLLLPVDSTNLIDGLQHRTQTAMDAKNTTIYDSTQSEVIEHFATPAPYVAAPILALTLVVKTVHLRYLT